MAITVPATSKNNADILNTTGLTITKPTGLQDDDVMYVVVSKFDDLGGDFYCTTSGWTLLAANQTTTGSDMNSAILRKVVSDASSEGASYTFRGSQGNAYEHAGIISIVRGADTTTPEDATTTESTGANDDNPDSPTITTVTNDALVLVFCCLNNQAGADLITFAAPSSYTLADSEAYDELAQCGVAYATKATAGATGAITWTNTADSNLAEYHTYTVAVKPAAAAPSGRGRLTYKPIFINPGIVGRS